MIRTFKLIKIWSFFDALLKVVSWRSKNICSVGNSKFGTLPRSAGTESSSTLSLSQLSLDEFLKRIGLGHCVLKLNMAGVNGVRDLIRLGHVDLLSYGLIADEVQAIRCALNR